MAEPFDVCWERIRRADTHNKSIASAWNAFIEEDSYDPLCSVYIDGTGRLTVTQVKPIPSVIALLIGEFLYQQRAALDSCIYELACKNSGQRPPPNEQVLEFPICKSPDTFKSSCWKIAPLTDEQRAIVESVQPYNIVPGLTPQEIPYSFNRGLEILNDWARIDRHRRLHVIGSWTDNIAPLFIVPKGTRLVDLKIARPGFMLNDEAEIASFRIEGWERGMNMEANPNVTFDIGINEIPLPCHHTDTLGKRFKCISIAVGTVVHALGKTVGIDRMK